MLNDELKCAPCHKQCMEIIECSHRLSNYCHFIELNMRFNDANQFHINVAINIIIFVSRILIDATDKQKNEHKFISKIEYFKCRNWRQRHIDIAIWNLFHEKQREKKTKSILHIHWFRCESKEVVTICRIVLLLVACEVSSSRLYVRFASRSIFFLSSTSDRNDIEWVTSTKRN